jgi:hypothetical protein
MKRCSSFSPQCYFSLIGESEKTLYGRSHSCIKIAVTVQDWTAQGDL